MTSYGPPGDVNAGTVLFLFFARSVKKNVALAKIRSHTPYAVKPPKLGEV